MPYYAVFNRDSGALCSIGTVLSKTLQPELGVITLDTKPTDSQLWDPQTRAFVSRPVKRVVDLLQIFANDDALQTILAKLTAQERQTLANRVLFLAGGKRYVTPQTALEMGIPANRITAALVNKSSGR